MYRQTGQASECPDVKNCKWQLNPVWHRMLYSCTHMAAVGIKGLKHKTSTQPTCRRDSNTADNNEINVKVVIKSDRLTVLVHSLHSSHAQPLDTAARQQSYP